MNVYVFRSGTTFITEKTIDVYVASLRKKLNGAANITSLRGVGYRLDER
ncbi:MULTISPECIES: winged helix-turn-helix domain-containing protein [Acidithrix]|uniref:OmpR/PhoB-type domain-containing protein n=1 Tax=Acidithrix ferrooxidans TaxID=1280514 RepID=A0A0D8HGD6_9ACTN|nr:MULTISPECIES: winged helix-turn-helix domain-containing protein [Acidithrix]KJF17050.1 hypothetical protein AXFE_21210 [Acidithrix ferrooxidans]